MFKKCALKLPVTRPKCAFGAIDPHVVRSSRPIAAAHAELWRSSRVGHLSFDLLGRLNQPFEHIHRVGIECAHDVNKFDHAETPFTTFVLGDKRLWPGETSGDHRFG